MNKEKLIEYVKDYLRDFDTEGSDSYRDFYRLSLRLTALLKDICNESILISLLSLLRKDIKKSNFRGASDAFLVSLEPHLKPFAQGKNTKKITSRLESRPRAYQHGKRGLSEENKVLLDAIKLLYQTDETINLYKTKMKKEEFFRLIRLANHLWNDERSIDAFVDSEGYSDDVKRLIAHGLSVFLEAEIILRGKWYRKYLEKGKDVALVPESGDYYQQIEKHFDILKKKPKGKQTTRERIHKDAREFIRHIKGGLYEGLRNEDFYNRKGFRAFLVTVAKIRKILSTGLTVADKKSLSQIKPVKKVSKYSVDKVIHKAMWKPRHIYGVGILRAPAPRIKLQ